MGHIVKFFCHLGKMVLSKRLIRFVTIYTNIWSKLLVLTIPIKWNHKLRALEIYHSEAQKNWFGYILVQMHAIMYLFYHTMRIFQIIRQPIEFQQSAHSYYTSIISILVDLTMYITQCATSIHIYQKRDEILRFLTMFVRMDVQMKGKIFFKY